jgi:hypothetical protein
MHKALYHGSLLERDYHGGAHKGSHDCRTEGGGCRDGTVLSVCDSRLLAIIIVSHNLCEGFGLVAEFLSTQPPSLRNECRV